jgi:four helix bundle protein
MNPKAAALRERTHQFFLRVIRFCEALPEVEAVLSIRRQLLDSSGSTDSNYRGACKARTRKEFISKVGVAAEEADESHGWLTALLGAGFGDATECQTLAREADELTRIFVASHKTAKKRLAEELARKQRRRHWRTGSVTSARSSRR